MPLRRRINSDGCMSLFEKRDQLKWETISHLTDAYRQLFPKVSREASARSESRSTSEARPSVSYNGTKITLELKRLHCLSKTKSYEATNTPRSYFGIGRLAYTEIDQKAIYVCLPHWNSMVMK